MPNLPISQLPAAGTLDGTELVPLVQSGITKYNTVDNIRFHNSNYGAFQTNQTLSGSANVSQSFKIDTTDESNGVSITNDSRLTFAHSGTYDIQFSSQIAQGSQKALIYIWFKQNGQNIPESNTAVNVNANDYAVASWNFMKSVNAGDYIELWWMSNQSTTTFPYFDPGNGMPLVPALIVTVTQVR